MTVQSKTSGSLQSFAFDFRDCFSSDFLSAFMQLFLSFRCYYGNFSFSFLFKKCFLLSSQMFSEAAFLHTLFEIFFLLVSDK